MNYCHFSIHNKNFFFQIFIPINYLQCMTNYTRRNNFQYTLDMPLHMSLLLSHKYTIKAKLTHSIIFQYTSLKNSYLQLDTLKTKTPLIKSSCAWYMSK